MVNVECEIELAFAAGIKAALTIYHQDANTHIGVDFDQMWQDYKLERFGTDRLNWRLVGDAKV